MSYDCSSPARVWSCVQKSTRRVTGGPWAIESHRAISGLEESVARYQMHAAPTASLSGSGSPERPCGGYSLSWSGGPSGNGALSGNGGPSVHAPYCCSLTSCLD